LIERENEKKSEKIFSFFSISFSISAMGVGKKATSGDWREEEAYRNRRGWLLLLS